MWHSCKVKPRALFLSLFLLVTTAATAADYLVYAGTYTRSSSKGIYVYRFDSSNGKLKPAGLAAETLNPSFLVVDPSHKFLYAVNEGGRGGNMVSAFAMDTKTGSLTALNQVSSNGEGPCHLAVDHSGRWLAVANYNNGTMALYPIHKDGRLGEAATVEKHEGSSVNPGRQRGPHAHEVVFSPDNRFLLLADLGLDKIFVYRFDAAKGTLTPNDPAFAAVPPGTGVRHMAFHPNGRLLYAIEEMGSSITAFHYDTASGVLHDFQNISTLPEGFKGQSSGAEIAVNAQGTTVYASNRGNDTIAVFHVDPVRFTISVVDHAPVLGKTPRHFALDPTGQYLLAANQDSNDITMFRVQGSTGQLQPASRVVTDLVAPVCVLFVPAK
jgi:6-phosphogluconolactonase